MKSIFPLLALFPVSLVCLIVPQPPAIHIRSIGATLAWPLTILGVPASCTSSQPSTWSVPLPCPWGDQPNPPTKAKAWLTLGVQEVKGGSDILYHSAGFSLIEVLLLLNVGQDGAWRAEGAERTVFSGSSKSSNFSEAKFSKVSGGDTGLLITECLAPVWYLAQIRYQQKTGLKRTGQLSSAPVYDECRRADVG